MHTLHICASFENVCDPCCCRAVVPLWCVWVSVQTVPPCHTGGRSQSSAKPADKEVQLADDSVGFAGPEPASCYLCWHPAHWDNTVTSKTQRGSSQQFLPSKASLLTPLAPHPPKCRRVENKSAPRPTGPVCTLLWRMFGAAGADPCGVS